MVDYDDWLKKAEKSLLELKVGKTFVVKDLFTGTKWNELTGAEKREFGKHFKRAVKNEKLVGVKHIGKMKNNSALYERIST